MSSGFLVIFTAASPDGKSVGILFFVGRQVHACCGETSPVCITGCGGGIGHSKKTALTFMPVCLSSADQVEKRRTAERRFFWFVRLGLGWHPAVRQHELYLVPSETVDDGSVMIFYVIFRRFTGVSDRTVGQKIFGDGFLHFQILRRISRTAPAVQALPLMVRMPFWFASRATALAECPAAYLSKRKRMVFACSG